MTPPRSQRRAWMVRIKHPEILRRAVWQRARDRGFPLVRLASVGPIGPGRAAWTAFCRDGGFGDVAAAFLEMGERR